jgi:hypothetical protein
MRSGWSAGALLGRAAPPTAVSQLRRYAPARDLVNRRRQQGDTPAGALRVLKRHLADVVFAALRRDDRASAGIGQPSPAWAPSAPPS